MKKGRFYRSDKSKAIVVCTGYNNNRVFSGTVVDGGLAGYDIGYSSYRWSVPSFKPCDVMNGFMLEDSHDIPNEHISTPKDSEVLIESNVKYYKHEFEGFIRYGKHIEDGRTTIITLCCNGDTKIFHLGEKPYPDINGCVKEIDENKFVEAYKRALKNLEL